MSIARAKGWGLYTCGDASPFRKFLSISCFGVLCSVTSSLVRHCTRSRHRRPWMHGGVDYLDAESIIAESIFALARLAESKSKDVMTLKF